ncbi:MAG: hypothetical protein ACTSPV_16895, partial [Candidatus Hodarchaeales archaeon]
YVIEILNEMKDDMKEIDRKLSLAIDKWGTVNGNQEVSLAQHHERIKTIERELTGVKNKMWALFFLILSSFAKFIFEFLSKTLKGG